MGTLNMLRIGVITFFGCLLIISISAGKQTADPPKLSREQANSVIKANRGLFSKTWNSLCDWDSVEAWTEFQDDVEEDVETGKVKKSDAEVLYECVHDCYWGDWWADFVDQAYEEQREEAESSFVPACRKCFDRMPPGFMDKVSHNCEIDRG